jgi:uncharacterized OB-fold protein
MAEEGPRLPRPVLEIDTAPYWEACRRHELRMQRCLNCGTHRFPPRALCFQCGSFETEWALMSGRGKVYSWVVPHHPVHPAAVSMVPYAVVLVQLVEGPRMPSHLVDVPWQEIKADMPVELVWEDVDEELTLPKFRLAREE